MGEEGRGFGTKIDAPVPARIIIRRASFPLDSLPPLDPSGRRAGTESPPPPPPPHVRYSETLRAAHSNDSYSNIRL